MNVDWCPKCAIPWEEHEDRACDCIQALRTVLENTQTQLKTANRVNEVLRAGLRNAKSQIEKYNMENAVKFCDLALEEAQTTIQKPISGCPHCGRGKECTCDRMDV